MRNTFEWQIQPFVRVLALGATLTVYFQRKTVRACGIVSEHFQCQSSWKSTYIYLSFFFKKAPYPAVQRSCLSTQVLSPLSFLSGHLSSAPFSQTSWHFFTFCSCFSQTLFPVLLLWLCEHVCMCECLCVCVCVFWSQRHCTLPTMYKNGPSVCACKCVCVFPARRGAGFLWLLQFAHTLVLVSDRVKQTQWEIKPEEAVITCVSEQILKERLFNMQWPENLAKAT